MQPNEIVLVIAFVGILSSGCGRNDSNCAPFCSVISSCTDDTYQSCMDACEGDFNESNDFSSACGTAVDDRSACVAGLSCEEVDAWMQKSPAEDYPCRDEDIAVEDEC